MFFIVERSPFCVISAKCKLASLRNILLFLYPDLSIKSSAGGFVIQEKDLLNEDFNSFNIVTEKKIDEKEKRAMKIGWKIVKYVNLEN